MVSATEYLDRTKSAATHLVRGIDGYRAILRKAPVPVLTAEYSNREEHDAQIEAWLESNADAIEARRRVESEYLAEHHALAALCGSLLQLSAMTIQLYSENARIPDCVTEIIQPKGRSLRFAVGRVVRTVPAGLIIYAGRNQYNHMDEKALREPNVSIFERLSTCSDYGDRIRDPAFDLSNDTVWNYAANIVALLGWTTYDAYRSDIERMLNI